MRHPDAEIIPAAIGDQRAEAFLPTGGFEISSRGNVCAACIFNVVSNTTSSLLDRERPSFVEFGRTHLELLAKFRVLIEGDLYAGHLFDHLTELFRELVVRFLVPVIARTDQA